MEALLKEAHQAPTGLSLSAMRSLLVPTIRTRICAMAAAPANCDGSGSWKLLLWQPPLAGGGGWASAADDRLQPESEASGALGERMLR